MGGDIIMDRHNDFSELTPNPMDISAREIFLQRLRDDGFEGDIEAELSSRLVFSTDNSIYQRVPLAVIFPRTTLDLNRAVRAAANGRLTLAVRGGGTGTNGQSLTPGIVVDVSRHMDRILHFDAQSQNVTVEPGVILARLNAFLRPHGLFFPPTVSTATRATIGGMIATDASGKGSRIYGKTSDYIEQLDVVLSDGSDLTVRKLTATELEAQKAKDDLGGAVYREVHRAVTEHADEITRVFPKMNRGLTGYNLQNVHSEDGSFDMTRLLAGSEGTLALTGKIVLRLKKIPQHRRLLVARYASFDGALRDVQELLSAQPSAVEVLDDRVLAVAKQDVTWTALEKVLGSGSNFPVLGLSFVEFVGDDLNTLHENISSASEILDQSSNHLIDYKAMLDDETISQLWTLREKSVGLLGRPQGNKQGVAFVEDTAIPPESLPEYVQEFRDILDGHGLTYGMFGHADVGCLHVRPFLDMLQSEDQSLIRAISDAVAQLTKRHGGLLWGEHGRGFRGEFSPLFFGEKLFLELCKIKEAFDPKDIFNRGKLAPVGEYAVDRIDTVPFKGTYDAQIAAPLREEYALSVTCNGNGACFNREPEMAMCPSYKATKDRRQSPKGRATLIRSWLRLRSLPQENTERQNLPQLSYELKDALDSCLSCKACATQCPIKVDIPSMRSRFLSEYFEEQKRPLRDYLVFWLEPLLAAGRAVPAISNLLMHNPLSRYLLRSIGLVDLPTFIPAALSSRQKLTRRWLTSRHEKKIVLLQDSFTGSFDGALIIRTHALLSGLGYDVRVTPAWSNGKARYVLGFYNGFARAGRHILRKVHAIERHNIPVIALDAATGLMFEQEYCELGERKPPVVWALERFLRSEIANGHIAPQSVATGGDAATILSHCTEQAVRPESAGDWAFILKSFGLNVSAGKAGCCGMAGMFGHQREQADLSKQIFHQNWAEKAEKPILATGFSCRCQTERMAGYRPSHPVEILAQALDRPARA